MSEQQQKKPFPVDARDVLGLLGLGLLAYGMSLFWWPGTFLVPGVILTLVAIFGTRS